MLYNVYTKEDNSMSEDQVKCKVCGAIRRQITVGHVRQHGFKDTKAYMQKYPDAEIFSKKTQEARRKSRGVKIDNPADIKEIKSDLKIPTHRTKKRITYEEFKKFIGEGCSLKDIIKSQGVSKHQIYFYSALAQGKINVTREQFDHDYATKTLDDLAKLYKISRENVTCLRDHYAIKRRSATYFHRKKTEKPLSFRQKQIVYGGLMGDASKMSPSSVKMKQSLKQKDYLMWKYEELKEHVSPVSLQEHSYYDKRYDKTYHNIRFYTYANTDVETIIRKFYGVDGKWVSDDVLNHINELAMAVWFMDDGTTDWYYRTQHNNKPTCKFCTDSFSFGDCERIILWFEEVWGIYATCVAVSGRQHHTRIKLDTKNTPKLFDLIRPYVIPSMLYKVDYQAYLQHKKDEE